MSSHPDARIGEFVEDVYNQVDDEDEGGGDQHEPLQGRIVGIDDRLHRILTKPAPREDRFDENGSTQQKADEEADQRDDRRQAVAQRIADDAAFGKTTRPLVADELAAPDFGKGRLAHFHQRARI